MTYIGSLGSSVEQSSLRQLVQTYMMGEEQQLQRLEASKAEYKGRLTAFTDLSSKLRALNDAISDFRWTGSLTPLNSFAAKSSSEAVTVSVDGSASEGSHTVAVHTMARAHSIASNAFLGEEAASMGGKHVLELVQGEETYKIAVSIDEDATNREALLAIVDAINGSDAQVNASLVQTDSRSGEYRILLTSQETGTSHVIHSLRDLTGELATHVGIQGDSDGIDFAANTVQEAVDASFSVDGLAFVSSSNRVENAIRGIRLDLNEVADEPLTVTVERDVEVVREGLDTFITAYNELVDYVRAQTQGAGSDGEGRGAMTGNSLFMNLRSSLRAQVAARLTADTEGEGALSGLGQIGITTTTDGKLRVSDADALEDALLTRAEAVEDLFADNENGIAVGLYDTVRGYVRAGGLISQERSLIGTRQRTLDRRIEREEAYLARREQQLTEQLAALQATFMELSSQNNLVQSMGSGSDLTSFLTGSG